MMGIEHAKVFANRQVAGRALAQAVTSMSLAQPILVLGLPRGGVPVAFEVAQALHAPLDVLVVRKIGMPGQPELAIGAIASGGIIVHEPAASVYLRDSGVEFEPLAEQERAELHRREEAYRPDAKPLALAGKTVVLVDDGLATGATMLAAVRAARKAGAHFIVVAAPVASHEAAKLLKHESDAVKILEIPPVLFAIGEWYEDFEQVQDSEVRALLTRSQQQEPPAAKPKQHAR